MYVDRENDMQNEWLTKLLDEAAEENEADRRAGLLDAAALIHDLATAALKVTP